jgi:hypothetical protein
MFSALVLAGWAAAPAWAGEKHEKCELSRVPANVKAAAGRVAPGVAWTKACKETAEGKTFYELCGKDAANRRIETEVADDGVVKEVETEIGESAVPANVRQVFRAKHPDFKASGAEQVVRNGQLFAYDFEGKKDGKYIEYRVHTADSSIKELTEEEEPQD